MPRMTLSVSVHHGVKAFTVDPSLQRKIKLENSILMELNKLGRVSRFRMIM
jgi:hypothetical protein